MINTEAVRTKKKNLIHYLENHDSLLVAFSGGVDSTFLLALAHQVLADKVIAITESSTTYPTREREEAIRFTKERGIEHIIFQADETSIAEFVANAPDRCYHCKKYLSKALLNIASERGISHVAYAANIDDLGDYRPGMDAAEKWGSSHLFWIPKYVKKKYGSCQERWDFPHGTNLLRHVSPQGFHMENQLQLKS